MRTKWTYIFSLILGLGTVAISLSFAADKKSVPEATVDIIKAPFNILEKVVNIKKMPELPQTFFETGKAPFDLARSFVELGMHQEFSSIGDRRGQSYSSLGNSYLALGDFDRAIEYFQKALERDPNKVDYLVLLGWAYFKSERYDEAIQTFKRVEEINPRVVDAYTGRGWIYFKKQEFEEAVKFFYSALEVNPQSSDAYAGLGWCFFRKDKTLLAEQYLQIALRKGLKNPEHTEPEAHRALGYLYFSQGDFKKALKHFKIAVRHRPGWNDARTKWADCLFALGKYADASSVYKHALRYEKSAELYDKLGWSYFYSDSKGFLKSPKSRLRKALEMFTEATIINADYKSSQEGIAAVEKKM